VSVAAAGTGSGSTRAGLPWPEGDPGALAQAATAAGAGAESLRSSAGRLQGEAAAAAGWSGQGAAAFHTAVGEEHAAMVRGAAGLEQAAAALKRLSTTLRDAQELVEQLAREVVEAEEAAEEAAVRAATARIAAMAASVELAFAGPDPSPSLQAAANDAADDAAVAGSAAADAEAHAQQVRARNTRRAQDAVDDVLREDRSTAAALDNAAAVAPLSGVPVGAPTPANNFARTALSGLSIDQWRAIAYWRAGIDPSTWRPQDGLLANDEIVQAVYRYYGGLYLDHPELQWAGMANVVGPMFYAGWQDMYAVRSLADDGQRARYLSELVGLPTLPGPVYDFADHLGDVVPGGFLDPGSLAEHLTSEEIEWYEDRFLGMQREIFDDLAWQHEAYILGGVPLLREIASRNPSELRPRDLESWEGIASGDPARIAEGNRELLLREQWRVIQDDYEAMREHHGPVGDVFTYTLSTMADNPMPGGQAYRDYDPIELELHIDSPDVPVGPLGPFGPHVDVGPPDIHVEQELPLPAGNLSNFEDRWAWIEDDMLPRYQDLLRDPGAARALIGSSVSERAEDFRRLPDLPYPGG
jgi:Proteins of 100 residues with WXG